MCFKFSKHMKKIERNGKVILIHSKNGKWIRMSQTVYQIINSEVENHNTIFDLYEKLYDDDDREFMKKIYGQLLELKLLIQKEEVDEKTSVILELTRRCNLKCKHCCINANFYSNTEEDLTISDIKKIISSIVNVHPRQITLTGGEPLLRDDFFEILEYLRSIYDGKISIMTNGTLINRNNVSKLVQCVNQVDISLDGVDERTCSLIRGKGVFTKVIENVKLLKEYKFEQISLSITIGDKNRDLEREFLILNENLGTYPQIRAFAPVGRGEVNNSLFYDTKVSDNIEKSFTDEILELKHTQKFTPCICNAGKEKLCIDYKGDVYPCQWFYDNSYKLGNVLKDNLKDLITKTIPEKLASYYPDRFYKCKDCDVNLFCWPCPGELMLNANDIDEFDELCKKMQPILYKHVWGE